MFFIKHKKILILVILVIAAYYNCLSNDFVSDDIPAILNNPNLGKLEYVLGQPMAFIQPLINSIVFNLFGRAPINFRLINVLFHAATVIALYLTIKQLFFERVAFWTAAIFAVHPLAVESVAWISGANYPRYSFFFLISLLFYLKSENNKKLFKWSLVFIILSFFSTEKAIVLPAVFFVYELSRGKLVKNWKKVGVIFLSALIFIIFYVGKVGERITAVTAASGAPAPIATNLFFQIPVAISTYIGLALYPANLTIYHSEMNFGGIQFFITLLFFLAAILAWIFLFFKNRRVFFFISIFFISLLPTLTPLGIAWIVAERYVYLGLTSLVLVFVYFVDWSMHKIKLESAAPYVFSIIILILLVQTAGRNIEWKNEDNLWVATARTSPSSPNTHNNMGDVYSRHGDLQNAIREFEWAIKLRPNYPEAYHNLALTLQTAGKLDEALKKYAKAIRLSPSLWQSHQNMAAIYFERGELDKSISHLKEAIKIYPQNQALRENLKIVEGNLK